MIRFFETLWDTMTKWELWFSHHSLIIWFIGLSHVRSWDDWWRPLFSAGFLAFIGLFATIQTIIVSRRIEKLAEAGGSRVPFVKEIPRVKPQQGDDHGEHEAGPQGAGLR